MTDPTPSRARRAESAARAFALELLSVSILLISIGAAITAVVQPINQLTQPGGTVLVELTEEAQEQALAALQGMPRGSWLQFDEGGFPMRLHIGSLDWPLRLLTEAGPSLLLGCLAAAGVLLHLTLRGIRAGAPFERANPLRLRVIGLLLILGGLGSQLLETVARMAVIEFSGAAASGVVAVSASLDLGWGLAGLAALALAEAFARGRALADDVDGLV